MALTITQTPATASLAQSPMVFTVSENSGVIFSSSFQYNCDLYYWDGTPSQSGSAQYQLVKYPNQSGVGMFEVSRIINSTLRDLREQNPSNVKYLKGDFYWTFLTGSTYASSSKISSGVYSALDGYGIFQEPIGQQLNDKSPFFPILTDGPSVQYHTSTNKGTLGVWLGNGPSGSQINGQLTAVYSASVNGVSAGDGELQLFGSISSSGQIAQIPLGANNADPPNPAGSVTIDTDYTIQIFSGSIALSEPILVKYICDTKYPNVRIKWKNRYGQFDYFNFNMISREGFDVQTKKYQPQLGTWTGQTLTYNGYDSSVLNYVSDSSQTLSVNTDWIDQDYNDILKQLLVSDEIYWIYDEGNTEAAGVEWSNDELLRPITIKTDTIQFKTGVVDKVIQYAFDFDYGQQYKLII
jgi:hypothetical protein